MSLNADKCRLLRNCNAKVEGSIPFTGTIHIKHLGQSARVGLFAGAAPGPRLAQSTRYNMQGLIGYIIIGGCVCAAVVAVALFVRDVRSSERAAEKRRRLVSRLVGK